MINIEKETIRTASVNYRIGAIYLINTKDRGWIAEIMFELIDENNTVFETIVIPKTGIDYNTFWESFTSGKYLYELLVEKEKLDIIIDTKIEEEFTNKVDVINEEINKV